MLCCFLTSTINSYGHGGTVSWPNHTFPVQAYNYQAVNQYSVPILSPVTDNCPSWISRRERMTVEKISWSVSTKEWCQPGASNTQPSDYQLDAHLTELLGLAYGICKTNWPQFMVQSFNYIGLLVFTEGHEAPSFISQGTIVLGKIQFCHFFSIQGSQGTIILPWWKTGQGQPRVIIWINLLVLCHLMLNIPSFKAINPEVLEKKIFNVFTIYGHCCHLAH